MTYDSWKERFLDKAADHRARWLQSKGYAVTPDDVRGRFADEPLTPEAVLDALATAGSEPAMEVDATTSDEELDQFLFGLDRSSPDP
jgi:hypothetical protein